MARAELLRQAAHRARNCLNGVVGLAELLGSPGMPPDPNLRASLVASARDLRCILQPLLDLASADPGLPREDRSLQLRPLLEELAEFQRLLARGRRIEVTYRRAEHGTSAVRADRLAFTLLLHLLVARVVAACDEGARVTISTEADQGVPRLRVAGAPLATSPRSAASTADAVLLDLATLRELGAPLGTRIVADDSPGMACLCLDLPAG